MTRIFAAWPVRQNQVELGLRQQSEDRLFNLCG
jgi:hypothetical protein